MFQKIQVVGIGPQYLDFHYKTSHSRHRQILKSTTDAGGSINNTLSSLSRLGISSAVSGIVGDDLNSKLLLNYLRKSHIDITNLVKLKKNRTGQAYVFTNHQGISTTYTSPGANNSFDKKHLLSLRLLETASWVHLTGFPHLKQHQFQSWIVHKLRGKVPTSYWLDETVEVFGYKQLKKILQFVDTVFVTETILNNLLKFTIPKSARKLLRLGCKVVVVLSRSHESDVFTTNDSYHISTKKIPMIDDSGTTSTFAAGYIFGRLKGYGLKKCALAGNTLMTLCSQQFGCHSHTLSPARLIQQMCLLKEDKNILIVGSGGREHAIAWKLHQSPGVHRLFVAPGNIGISQVARTVNIADSDINGLKDFVKKQDIDMTIIGPEAPLSMGIVDEFEKDGLAILGPSKKAAMLETSKSFAKEFMTKFNIPTAKYKVFNSYKTAVRYVNKSPYPLVVKADGLAGGKGVRVCKNKKEAQEWLQFLMVDKKFASAGIKVVIEECLHGQEASFLAFTDGTYIVPLLPAQDYKPLLNNDKGPNTGGMGAYAPAPLITPKILAVVNRKILQPTIAGMKKIKRIYKGIIYLGLMITKDGPKVIEYNCRLGDPETQAILPLLETDLLQLIEATLLGNLQKFEVSWKMGACVCVVVASGGYPGKPVTGDEIKGLKNLAKFPHADVFHSGTDSRIITSGGRVLGIYATGDDLKDAMKKAYAGVKHVTFPAMHSRRDIGKKGLKYKSNMNH